MIRTLPEYLKRGGTKSAIADQWGQSRQEVGRMTKINPEIYKVEFNVMNPKQVLKFWRQESKKTVPEKVFFDVSKGENNAQPRD